MKNTTKKILTAALTLALTLAMSTASFAADAKVDANGGSQTIEVNAKYDDSISTPTVYHVDIAWGAMEFTYQVSGTKNWNPEEHEYTTSASSSWAASGNEITVTNHSNAGIKADFTYTKEAGFDTVTGGFSVASLTLPSAENKAVDDAALIGTTSLTLGGTLASDKTTLTKVGTIAVTISES